VAEARRRAEILMATMVMIVGRELRRIGEDE